MTVIVCDASLVATILMPDEWNERVPVVAAALGAAELWVPAHFALEIISLLATAERGGRIARDDRLRCLAEARASGVSVDPRSSRPSTTIGDIALAASISVYDAAYLELAVRRAATLGTNDRRLIAAARARGVPVLTTRP